MGACSFCRGHGIAPTWHPAHGEVPERVSLNACIVCGLVCLPDRLAIDPSQSLPTPPAQEAHTQPGESETAGQDVRRWVDLGDITRLVAEYAREVRAEGYAAGKADALARVRAEVEGLRPCNLDATWVSWPHGPGFGAIEKRDVLAIIARVAGEWS